MTFLPIVGRELRTAARRTATYQSRTIAAAIMMVVAGVMFLFSLLSFSRSGQGAAMFHVLGNLALVFCVFEGARKTADCLSQERREGTLGLLFLTDLKGYDIVLGKLVGKSLASIYGLFAILPIMALPLLLGGVMPGEFWRTALALTNVLFFSLSAGIWVSSRCRQERHAMTGTAAIVLGCLFLPEVSMGGTLVPLSPSHAYTHASAVMYLSGAAGYWRSLLYTQLLSWFLLAWASFTVARFREDGQSRTLGFRRKIIWKQRRPSDAATRAQLLDLNPTVWLAMRDAGRSGQFGPVAAMIVLACSACLLWLFGWFLGSDFLGVYFGIVLIANYLIKVRVATQACHCLAEARNNSALEMLLSTPLTVDEIIRGQILALKRIFLRPLVFLMVLEILVGLGLALTMRHFAKPEDDAIPWWGIMMALGMGLLYYGLACLDLLAVTWMGMWFGLSAKSETQAVFKTVLYVLVLPFLCFGVCWLGMPAFIGWPLICFLVARDKVRSRFRVLAGQRFTPESEARSWWWPAPRERRPPRIVGG